MKQLPRFQWPMRLFVLLGYLYMNVKYPNDYTVLEWHPVSFWASECDTRPCLNLVVKPRKAYDFLPCYSHLSLKQGIFISL